MSNVKFYIRYSLYHCENEIILDTLSQYMNWAFTMEENFSTMFEILIMKNFIVLGE